MEYMNVCVVDCMKIDDVKNGTSSSSRADRMNPFHTLSTSVPIGHRSLQVL